MTEVTEKMIEAGCRERCRQEGRIADYMVHYVGTGEYRYACDPNPQAEIAPMWRWKFYESFKKELEAALATREPSERSRIKRNRQALDQMSEVLKAMRSTVYEQPVGVWWGAIDKAIIAADGAKL